MLNPIRNVEKSLGAGGPGETVIAPKRSSFSAMRRQPHNYPVRRAGAGSGLGAIRLQAGGNLDEESTDTERSAAPAEAVQEAPASVPDPSDLREPDSDLSPRDAQMREIVIDAMAALRGEHPDPEAAIRRFIDTFGEADFRELRRMVLGAQGPDEGDGDQEPDEGDEEDDGGDDDGEESMQRAGGMQVGGLLKGPGSGQSDDIEASTPSGRRVLLSDGEYVIDAPTVAALGDGSTEAGARRLDGFRKAIRQQAYGHDGQAKTMRRGGRAILAALGQ